MRFINSNPILPLALLCSLSMSAWGRQQDQTPTAPAQPPDSTQPQNQPAQPAKAAPDQSQPEAPSKEPSPTEPFPTPSPQETSPPQPAPQAAAPSTQKEETGTSAKSRSTRKRRKVPAQSQSSTQGGKVVVRNGGTSETTPQISPGVTDQQAQHQREINTQLLATADANIKRVSGKQLTPAQQSMLDQVNTFVRQSKAASDTGDLSRAHMLAVKAQLLSSELARK